MTSPPPLLDACQAARALSRCTDIRELGHDPWEPEVWELYRADVLPAAAHDETTGLPLFSAQDLAVVPVGVISLLWDAASQRERPAVLGRTRLAGELGHALGLGRTLTENEFAAAARSGLICPFGLFREFVTWWARDCDIHYASTPEAWEIIRATAALRVDVWQVADELGLPEPAVASACGVSPSEAIPKDLADEMIRREGATYAKICIGADRAADHLGIRTTDFKHLVSLGATTPDHHIEVAHPRGRGTIMMPVFALGALDDLAENPTIPWAEIRDTPRGKPSPLAALAPKKPAPTATLRRFLKKHSPSDAKVLLHWYSTSRCWDVGIKTTEPLPALHGRLRDMLDQDADIHEAGINPDDVGFGHGPCGAVAQAFQWVQPGAAVIIDTETTSLEAPHIVEIAVIDAATGKTLLNERIKPAAPIEPGAHSVHLISDADVADCPTIKDVLPKLQRITRGKTILAWNANFDRQAVHISLNAAGVKPRTLTAPNRWACLMELTMQAHNTHHRIALNGPHAAIGDCQKARDELTTIAVLAERTQR